MKKYAVVVLLLAALVFSLAGCTEKPAEVDISSAMAIMNDVPVAQWEYNFYYKQAVASLAQFGIAVDEDSDPGLLAIVEEQAMNDVLANEAIRQLALARELSVTDEKVEALLTSEITNTFGGQENFQSWLDAQGITRENTLEMLRTQSLAYLLYEDTSKLVEVTDAEAQSLYEEDPTKWDCRQVSHILVKVDSSATEEEIAAAKAEAEALIERLNAGEDFAEMAIAESDDTGSAIYGGSLSEGVTETDSIYLPEFTVGAFALEKEGDFSQEPVQSSVGWHIIKWDSTKTGFEEFKEDIHSQLLSEKQAEAYQDLVLNYVADSTVTRLINFVGWETGNETYPLDESAVVEPNEQNNEEDLNNEETNNEENQNDDVTQSGNDSNPDGSTE